MTCDICGERVQDRRAHTHPGKRGKTPADHYAALVKRQEQDLIRQIYRNARAQA